MSREDITPLTPKALQVSLPIESRADSSSFWKKKLYSSSTPICLPFAPLSSVYFWILSPQPPIPSILYR
ncbi:hypothetical protein CEXT_620291 [Caerostris extrusa]|uniref:Uncharacterized protein n=1 Tax=Caerostris extrusa TaxID=172846 RepID=A0AAV4WWI0_CAEEX|nr:hypothetical protein CEXT_620291 [Caerostris extrusa]